MWGNYSFLWQPPALMVVWILSQQGSLPQFWSGILSLFNRTLPLYEITCQNYLSLSPSTKRFSLFDMACINGYQARKVLQFLPWSPNLFAMTLLKSSQYKLINYSSDQTVLYMFAEYMFNKQFVWQGFNVSMCLILWNMMMTSPTSWSSPPGEPLWGQVPFLSSSTAVTYRAKASLLST